MGVVPLILLYLIRIFLRVDLWNEKLPYACSIIYIINCNICKFTRSTSKLSLIAQRKPNKYSFDYVASKLQLELVYLQVT
jgi:hypothetical protein